jgi:hypothetical protein
MLRRPIPWPLLLALWAAFVPAARAADPPVVGLIPRATRPIQLDGRLDDWEGAFVTPVHVGHPDFADRGAQFLFLWDDDALYVGLRALDRKPAHVGPDASLWDGDAVEFYLDTRRGADLGAKDFGPGTLHMFWTPFTGTEVKPRLRVRDLPAFKGLTLQGAEVAGAKTPWGYTAEFKLPWANFPKFTPKAGEVIGIDCELCSSDGGPRVDRTFVYSSPASVSSPSAFGRVRLVEKIDPADLKPCARALLPVSLTKSANYDWLYATACLSPTIDKMTAKVEGKVIDADGKVRKTTAGGRTTLEGSGFVLWRGQWELFDLPAGTYTVEISALDRDGKPVVTRSIKLAHGEEPAARAAQNPSPMVEHARTHPRLKQETPGGRREKLSTGTLFVPEGLKGERVPLFVHFHGAPWLAEVAAAKCGKAAVIAVSLGSGSATYARPFADPKAFPALLKEAEEKAGVRFGPVGLTAWSAGYGAVREILKTADGYDRVSFVLLIDGLHAGYEGGKPGPLESKLVTADLEVFVRLARDAAAGRKQLIVTHSEIFPGTFASTTETADYLLREVGVRRTAVLRWGPMETQQLSEARKGKLLVAGYAGNSAPDHVDQLHALPEYLAWVEWTGGN